LGKHNLFTGAARAKRTVLDGPLSGEPRSR
jgi:hypothetical protein